MRTLYLSWQSKKTRHWFPVGRLDVCVVNQPWYVYRYIVGAMEAKKEANFYPLLEFPTLERAYQQPYLFPTFANRVIATNRPDRKDYLAKLGLSEDADPVDILSINGGKRVTDTYQVFPKLVKNEDSSFNCRFFLHGWKYVDKRAQDRIAALEIHENLKIRLEPENSEDRSALIILTGDDYKIGYTPRYLDTDLSYAVKSRQVESLKVVGHNTNGIVPSSQRILIEMKGTWSNYAPMEGEEFKPLVDFPSNLIGA